MAAGDLLTAADAYQIELRGLLMGDGTDYLVDVDGGAVRGLYDAEPSIAETEYLHAPGSFVGEARESARTVSVALIIVGDTAAAVGSALLTLRSAWAPTATTTEQLHVGVPGIGHRYVIGWPTGVVADVSYLSALEVPALCTFRATDPELYL